MAKRAMTIKSFISKATSTASAQGFLAQHREYLQSGEIAAIAQPLMVKIDAGELDVELGLEQITNAIFSHMMELTVQKAQAQIVKANSKVATAPTKNYTATIFDDQSEIESKGFDLPQDAERFADRRLSAGGPAYHALIQHNKSSYQEIILRDDAIARLNPRVKGAVLKRRPTSVSRLSGVMSAKQDRSHFSHG